MQCVLFYPCFTNIDWDRMVKTLEYVCQLRVLINTALTVKRDKSSLELFRSDTENA